MKYTIDDLQLTESEIREKLRSIKTCDNDEVSRFFLYLRIHCGGVLAVDIDGILCELDDSPFCAKTPLVKEIKETAYKWVILYTARLECDREETEEWLNRHGIRYDALITNKLPYDLLIDDRTNSKL